MLKRHREVLRNWQIWYEYRRGGETYKSLGQRYGISGPRVQQILGVRRRMLAIARRCLQ